MTISNVTIVGHSVTESKTEANQVILDITVNTTQVSEDERFDFRVDAKYAAGNKGTLYDGRLFYTTSENTIYGNAEFSFTLPVEFDHLFVGSTFSFQVDVNGVKSQWYDIFLPNVFDWPLEGSSECYMISERPTQQAQFVYYNGTYKANAGCCVASALAAAKEVQEIRSGRGVLHHSVGWFFGATADGDNGTTYATALDFLRDKGMMLFEHARSAHVANYPDVYFYSDRDGFSGARSLYQAHQDFTKSIPQKIKSWRKLTGEWNEPFGWQSVFEAVKRTSGNGSSAVLVTVGTDDAFNAAGTNGIMPENYGNFIDGHMMLVLGWKMVEYGDGIKRLCVICQNSWGGSWGDDGLIYIPLVNTRHFVNGYLTGIYDFYEIVDDPDAPALTGRFNWSYAGLDSSGVPVAGAEKKAGYGIYVTTDEWNTLAGLVKTATGKSVTTVNPGDPIAAETVNTMASALNVKTVAPEDAITASFFNALRDAYNALS